MSLLPHQQTARSAVYAAWRDGVRRVLVVMPTGGGKTRLGSTIASDYLGKHVANGGRVAWLAHRGELVSQAVATLRAMGLVVGEGGFDPMAPVQVVTVQSALARGEAPQGTLVVADEAHHYAEDNDWSRVLAAYIASNARIVGLTATPERGDGNGLAHMFERMVVAAQVKELQSAGILVPCVVHAPRGGKLKPDQLVREPVQAYQEKTPAGRAVCFAPHEKAAWDYARAFNAAGIRAAVVLGKTPWAERERMLADFAAGRVRVLCNVFVLTEGWDSPGCDTVIIARGCQSAGTFLQMTGRGLRAAPGKTECHLLDLRGVTYDHGAPDEEREFSLDGRAIKRRVVLAGALCSLCKEPLPDGCVRCPNCQKEREPSTTPRGIGGALERYAGLAGAPAPTRAKVLAGILSNKGRGRSSKAAAVIFKQMFKQWPTGADFHAAHIINGGRHEGRQAE